MKYCIRMDMTPTAFEAANRNVDIFFDELKKDFLEKAKEHPPNGGMIVFELVWMKYEDKYCEKHDEHYTSEYPECRQCSIEKAKR